MYIPAIQYYSISQTLYIIHSDTVEDSVASY